MRSRITLATMALVVGAALPALAAPPFGEFGGKVGGGNAGSGLLPVYGWALDDNGVDAVDILVDGKVAGRANYGRSRPRATQQFPGFPDSAAPGFAFQIDTTHYLNGRHTVAARVRSESGEVVTLRPRTFEFLNTETELKPFGDIEFPLQGVEMRGNCDGSPLRRYSVISGYALDVGVTQHDTGVNYVELFLDGALVSHSKLNCTFTPALGGEVNCYGQRRQDLVKLFPHLKNNPHVGFRFLVDVGALLLGGVVPGSHRFSVRSGDNGDQYSIIKDLQVYLVCDPPDDNELSFGDAALPNPSQPQGGTVTFKGWALDIQGVLDVAIFVDGDLIGLATYGFSRPDVLALYPSFPDSLAPGWQMVVDTTELSNGEHRLEVRVRDDLGAETYIGNKKFVVANPH